MQRSINILQHVRSVMDPDGAVLLDLRQGKYYSLNGVGAEIWSQIESHLVEAFGAPQEAARADVAAFVEDLTRKNLVDARV
ncbi:MAG TPA: PqqD family protein [Longimicrobium sp.]|nr:PqqD family protein [Longimicrobium sp.]